MSIAAYNNIFQKPFPKTLVLEFDDNPQTIISNDKIIQESMSLEESLCSDMNIRYGGCESSCFRVRVVNSGSLKGKTFTAKLKFYGKGHLIDGEGNNLVDDDNNYLSYYNSTSESTITIGKYKVYSDKPTNDRVYRDLVCYDAMQEIIDVDVATWYEGLTFPITLKNFRDSLFTFLGVTQVTTTLINDNYSIKGGFQANVLSSKDILESICEANGVFGHINKEGKFEYISLPASETITLHWWKNGSGGFEDYVTDAITGVKNISIDNDEGTVVGTTTNLYVINNNLVFYGDEGTQAETTALTNLFNKIKLFTYRPFSVKTYGNPMMELGTGIVVDSSLQTINSFVMNRYLSGIQAMTDEYSSYGDKTYPQDINSLETDVKRTAGKTAKIRQELDSFSVDYANYKDQVASQFEQTAEDISLSVKGVVERAAMIVECYRVDTSSTTATLQCRGNVDYFSVEQNTVFGIRMTGEFSTTALQLNKELTVNLTTPVGPLGFSGDMYFNSTTRLTNQIKVEANDILYVRITGTDDNPTFTVLTEALSHSEITVMKDKIVLKVDSGGKIVAVKLSADPTGSALQIGADNINLTANDVFNIISGGTLNLTGKNVSISSTNFSVTSAGVITATSGKIGGWSILSDRLYNLDSATGNYVALFDGTNTDKYVFYIRTGTSSADYDWPFIVKSNGELTTKKINATGGSIAGWTISSTGLSSDGSSINRGGSITLRQSSSSTSGLSLDYDGIAFYGGTLWYNVLLKQSGKITLNAEEVVANSHKLTEKLNSSNGIYTDTSSSTSGYCLHGRGTGHSYQCNWTGSQLDFYVDTTNVGALSDKRLKKDIEDVDNKLIEAINDCPMKQYKAENRGGLISFGIIAQDLVKACEDRDIDILDYEILQKKHYKDGDETEYYMIDNGQLAILEIQALKEEIKELRRIING